MPNKQSVEVAAVYGETEEEMTIAQCGDQVRLRLRGIEEEEVVPGFVLCSPKRLIHNVKQFECQIRILELKSILSAGYDCVLHVHSAIEEVTFATLLHKLQKGTNRKSRLPPSHAKKGDSIIARLEVTGGAGSVCVETYDDAPQLGRFTLRDQGQTIAIGKSKFLPLAHGGGLWLTQYLSHQTHPGRCRLNGRCLTRLSLVQERQAVCVSNQKSQPNGWAGEGGGIGAIAWNRRV